MKSAIKKMLYFDVILLYLIVILSFTQNIEGSISTTNTIVEKKVGQYDELSKKVALTFDDGPNPDYTPKVLDVLKEKNVKATFFLLGEEVEKYPELVKRMKEEGHEVGNHSYRHERLVLLPDEQACFQVKRTNDLIYDIIGEYPGFFRPPFGEWDKELESEINMLEILWDIDTLDWSVQNHKKIVTSVLGNVKEDGIILMHDGYETTVSATAEIIELLQKDNYEFVTIDKLIFE